MPRLLPERPMQVALLVAAAFFMENLDGTVIATALPQMAVSFRVDAVDLNIGMTSYLLTLAVFIPISGWLADRFGPRTVFTAAIAVFTAASILCGASQGLWSFTAFRVLQGVGGAMMVPVGRLVVLRGTEKRDLLRAMAYITWPGLAAPVIGPPVGGFITTYLTWRWIFYLNVPLGIAGLLLALRLIENRRSTSRPPFDLAGFVLSGAALSCLLYGLELLTGSGATIATALGCLAVGGVAGVAAVRRFRRAASPLIDLAPLAVPTFAVSIWGGSLFRIAISAAPFLLPLMFQLGFGLNAFTSGLLVLCVFAGNLGMKVAANATLRRFGFRTVMIANGVLAAVSLLACAALGPQTPYLVIVPVLFASGLSRSLQFTAINTIAFADMPQAKMSAASTLSSVVFQLGFGLGVAFGAIALRLAVLWRTGIAGAPPAVADFHLAFAAVACLALLALFDTVPLPRDAGAAVSGHRVSLARSIRGRG